MWPRSKLAFEDWMPTLPRFEPVCHEIKAHCGQIGNIDGSLLQHRAFKEVNKLRRGKAIDG
jgi:hypothetical protein